MCIKLTKQECVGNALPGKRQSLGEPDCVDLMIRICTPRVSACSGNTSYWRVRSAPVRTMVTSIGSKGHSVYLQAKGIARLPSHQRLSWTLKGNTGVGLQGLRKRQETYFFCPPCDWLIFIQFKNNSEILPKY